MLILKEADSAEVFVAELLKINFKLSVLVPKDDENLNSTDCVKLLPVMKKDFSS